MYFNPFTPKSDQVQISPAASPVILHHTVWRTWLFIAYSYERWLYYQFWVISLNGRMYFNPFTPKSDQVQISPAASPVILHHTVWRIWLFIAYSDEKWLYYQIRIASLIHFCIKGWENVLFELGSERDREPVFCHCAHVHVHNGKYLEELVFYHSCKLHTRYTLWLCTVHNDEKQWKIEAQVTAWTLVLSKSLSIRDSKYSIIILDTLN